MKLGRVATLTQVVATYCADEHILGTFPIDDTAYQLAAAYYGWNFGAAGPDLARPTC
jgi:hypothetical protein